MSIVRKNMGGKKAPLKVMPMGQYTMKHTDDPEVYGFWSTYTLVSGKVVPMLCFTMHSDTIKSAWLNLYAEGADVTLEFVLSSDSESR